MCPRGQSFLILSSLKISRGRKGQNVQIPSICILLIRSNLRNYSDAYIHVKGTITVVNTAAATAPVNNTNEKVIFKNCAPFTNCISEINNTQVDDVQNINIVMPSYNLIEYSNFYLKT